MNKRWMTWSVLGALATAGLGFAGARALATGAPQLSPLTYGGVLTDKDGKAYPSVQEVVLKFYDKVDATSPKCTAPATQAEAGTGRFSVVLPGECAQAVRDSPDLWSEATVGGGKTVLPRVHVGAVPYALEADSAKVAAGATGGLKAALDGVVADVAALKKAPAGGGAPKVVDGAGVVLGTLVSYASTANMAIMSGQGYVFYIGPDAKPLLSEKIYYTQPGCSGAAYRVADPAYVGGWARYAVPNGAGYWFVDIIGSSPVKSNKFVVASLDDKGKCVDAVGNGDGVLVAKYTQKEIGLPDVIILPLKFVP